MLKRPAAIAVIGLVLLFLLSLVVDVTAPAPYFLMRCIVTLAMGTAAGDLVGSIIVNAPFGIKATGGFAVAAMVWFWNPAALVAPAGARADAARSYQLRQVTGDSQRTAAGDSGKFGVRVVDQHGKPVPQAKVLWRSPLDTSKGFVSLTDSNGFAAAMTVTSGMKADAYLQTAHIAVNDPKLGATPLGGVKTAGPVASFRYPMNSQLPAGTPNTPGAVRRGFRVNINTPQSLIDLPANSPLKTLTIAGQWNPGPPHSVCWDVSGYMRRPDGGLDSIAGFIVRRRVIATGHVLDTTVWRGNPWTFAPSNQRIRIEVEISDNNPPDNTVCGGTQELYLTLRP